MTIKHIVFVTYNYWPPQFGGELLLSIERFQGLVARGFEVVALTSGHPNFPARQHLQGITVFRSPVVGKSHPARLLRRIVYVVWACWMLMKLSFDIYYQGNTAGVDHATSAMMVWLFTRIASWKKAQTVIVHSIADTECKAFDPRGWTGFWRRLMFGCFEKIVAVSPALYEGLKPTFPRSARLIVNGVRDDIFVPLNSFARQQFRHEKSVADRDMVFAFLGTVGVRKGFDVLAQAFLPLAQQYPNWRLWVIGPYAPEHSQNLDVDETRRVMEILEPVGQQVKYWGLVYERDQLRQILAAADGFVFPSRREGMGLAPVEAMAVGLPVIIARIPSITDLASLEGITGLYVSVGDVDTLKTAMEKLGNQPDLRQEMGTQAVKRVHEAFGWQAHLDQWERLYLRSCRK